MFRNVQGGTASGRSPFVALWQREVVADCLAFGVVVESLQRGAEEEKAQHHEDEEQLDEDENPQRASPSHLAEAGDIKCPHVAKDVTDSLHVGKYRNF